MRVRTPDELERAINDIAYSIRQGCLAHQHYHYVVIPVLRKNGVPDATVRIVKNASFEAQLLFLRKLNEFFKPLATDKELEEDDVRAEHYAGFKSPGPFLSRPDEKEIHKRVGHITLMEARYEKRIGQNLLKAPR
jgi:hypothetical protein